MAIPFFFFFFLVTFNLSILRVFSFEPAPLQDFCVADPTNLVAVRVNGMACKNPMFVQAEDFYYGGLHIAGDTRNSYGYRVTPVTVYQIPGLNTLGLSLIRIDYALWGANPPHTHPRATEVLMVLEGTLQVGFVTSDPQNRLLTKVLQKVRVNGMPCKNPMQVQANDFSFNGLHLMGNTSNPFGSSVTPVTVGQLPGVNTLGISMVRIDFSPWGINPPHTHPRATEIITVLEGSIQVGFITTDPENRLITKVLYKGDVFVFPIGLLHFQYNIGNKCAVVIGALNSQNPGAITIGNAVFGSNPEIMSDILAKAFQVDKIVIDQIKAKF